MIGIETITKVEWLLNMLSTATSIFASIFVTPQGAPVVSQCTHCAISCPMSSATETDKRTLVSGFVGGGGAKFEYEAEAGGLGYKGVFSSGGAPASSLGTNPSSVPP